MLLVEFVVGGRIVMPRVTDDAVIYMCSHSGAAFNARRTLLSAWR